MFRPSPGQVLNRHACEFFAHMVPRVAKTWAPHTAIPTLQRKAGWRAGAPWFTNPSPNGQWMRNALDCKLYDGTESTKAGGGV